MCCIVMVSLAPDAQAQTATDSLAPKPRSVAPSMAPAVATPPRSTVLHLHAGLGTLALGCFSSSLMIASASGNMGKLMDSDACCPDGGQRDPTWRTTNRVLVTTGIVAYSAAATLAVYSLLTRDPPSEGHEEKHSAHRWLALGHGAAFLTSAVTGIIMSRSQASDPERFSDTARVHMASNVVLVPLLTMAFSNILFE